jgi:hypothetical protein
MVAHSGVATDGRAKGLSEPVDMVDGATSCRKNEKNGKGLKAIFTFEAVEQRHAEEGWTLTCNVCKPSDGVGIILVSGAAVIGAANLAKASPGVRAWLDALLSLPDGSGTLLTWRKAGEAAGVVKGVGDEPPGPEAVRKSFKRARELLVKLNAVRINSDGTVSATLADMTEPDDDDEGGDFDENDE